MSGPDFPTNPIISDLSGDVDMRELLEEFVEDLPKRVEDIEKMTAACDLTTLGRLVHQLKGAAGSYGFRRVSGQAAEVESSIKAHSDLADIAREVRELAELCSRVRTTPNAQ